MSRKTPSILDRIVGSIERGFKCLCEREDAVLKAVQATDQHVLANGRKLDQILSILQEPAEVAGTVVTVSLEGTSKMTPSANFTFPDAGKALLTISFVDSIGEPTKPVDGASVSTSWTSSDPGVTVTDRGDGLNADVALASPPPNPLPTGVVITASTVVTNPDTTVLGPFTAQGAPIDVVAGGPAGITIQESAE